MIFLLSTIATGPPPTTGRRWNERQNAIQPAVPYARRIMLNFRYIYRWPGDWRSLSLNLWIQISQTAGASGDWWHSQHRPKQYRVGPSFQTSGESQPSICYQLASTRPPVTRLMNFRARVICEDSSFIAGASDGFPCQEPDRKDFSRFAPAPAWGQNHGSAPGLYRVPDLSQ